MGLPGLPGVEVSSHGYTLSSAGALWSGPPEDRNFFFWVGGGGLIFIYSCSTQLISFEIEI